MQRLRATRATTPSRGFITRAASALMFIGATALAIALPGDAAAERDSITPSFNEWRDSGSPAPNEGHWLDADIGTFRITRGDGLQDRVFRAWQKRVHQEPERAAREIHSMLIGGSEGRDKLRQMLLNAAEGNEMVTSLELDAWWESYSRSYLLDLADSGVEEILAYGEERMRERLGFVRNVNLEYRTPLGGRTGYGALSFVGPLQEGADDVIAWQMRASHNEDAETGANLGLIYRQARDRQSGHHGTPMLLGVNAFLDFETHRAGNFLRYSIGGEIRTGTIDFYGNYYVPLTDPRVDNDGTTYYSAEGLDVEANIGVPSADWLSAVLGYYWWDGEGPHDGEQGQKIGLRARPNSLWEIELEYDWADDRQDEFGGRLSYSRQIGEHPTFTASSRPFGGNFNPRNHFYDIVRREYSHRIRSYGGVGDPVIIPSASDVVGVAEFSGVATLDASNTGDNVTVEVSYPIAGTSTVNVTGGEALVGLGFGNSTPAGTITFMDGEYVIDVAARAIIVRSGAVYWDDPRAGWADNFGFEGGGKSGSTVILTGTGFEGNATAGTFVLYEGNGEASDVAAPDTAISLRCDQSSNEGRTRAGDYTTECYGDLASDSTGPMLVLGGTAMEANADYPNPDETQLAASGAAMFHMRGGRGRGIGETAANYTPQIAFTGENTVAIKNDVAGGERYIKGDDFSINGDSVGCDHTTETVLRYVGGVAAYCQSGLDAFTQTPPPAPVGVANTGFTSGGTLLTVGNPNAIAGVGGLYAVVSPTVGFSVDDTGVLSGDGDGISNLTDGPNDVIVNQRIGSIPGSGLPEERMIDLNVHKLIDRGAPIVILIGKDPADTALTDNDIFPNGRGVSGDNLGFVFEDVGIEGVDTTGLTVANVTYDSSTNEFSIGAELTEGDISDNYIVVTMTASNVRGTHIMTVNVGVVDRIVIEAANQVSPNENIAAAADYTGPIAEAAGLVNSGAAGNVTFQCSVVGGANQDDFSASATGTGCNVNLNDAIGDAATSVVVQIEIVHTATAPYTQRLLAPFNGQQPDGSGDSIPDTVITANITVWKAEPGAAQGNNANSDGPVSGVSFDPPANPDASVDFQDGTETWAVVGTPEEGLQVGEDGVVSGNVSDRPGDDADTGIYIVTITANFMHGLLAGLLPVELELTVSDFSSPTTLNVVATDATGMVIVEVNGVGQATVGTTETAVIASSNRDEIRVVAAPNAGYHVEAWSGLGGGIGTDFAASCPTGHGGFKYCTLPNRTEDSPINLTVEFASGAIHPDFPETGDIAGDIYNCFALGGRIVDSPADVSCVEYTANSAAAAGCILMALVPGVDATCVQAFSETRDCNVGNKPAADRVSGTVTCGSDCATGEVAIGGRCRGENPKSVTYDVDGSGQIAAYYASSGQLAGGLIPYGALLSVVATPANPSGSFVSGWSVSCDNDADLSAINSRFPRPVGAGGNLGDPGAKFCLARVTINLDITASIGDIPGGYQPTPEIPSDFNTSSDTATHQMVCEGLGGTYAVVSGAGECSELWADSVGDPNVSCQMSSAFGDGVCGRALQGVKDCNDLNMIAQTLGIPGDLLGTACGMVCTSGYARGATCVGGLASAVGQGLHLSADGSAAANVKKKSGVKTRAIGNSLPTGGFSFVEEPTIDNSGAAIPDVLPSEIPKTGDIDLTTYSSETICNAFRGTYSTAFGGLCAGIAEGLAFCTDTRNCQGLYESVRACHDMGFKGGNAQGACGGACPEGLTPHGIECVSETGGKIDRTLATGELPEDVPETGDIDLTTYSSETICKAFEGTYSTAFGGLCAGIAEGLAFCTDTRNCQGLYESVRACHLNQNSKGGNAQGACGSQCLGGLVALGNSCVASTAPQDGIEITRPPVERGGLEATSGGNTVTVGQFTELVQDQVVTITATPADGYYLARWTGSCANAETDGNPATSASSVAYSPDKQTCILQRSGADGSDAAALSAGAEFEYGLLPSAVRQFADATIIETPTADHCEALGGDAGVTLGTGTSGVNYCDGYNEDTPDESTGGVEEDENIEDQCWLFGGGVVSDPTAENNVQLCRNALAHTIQCNKLNMKSASNLPAPVSRECGSGQTDTETCAAVASARAVDSPSADLLCGDPCGDGMIARGGTCVSAAAAASGDDSDAIGGAY